jgi:CRISPR-associated protein Cas6
LNDSSTTTDAYWDQSPNRFNESPFVSVSFTVSGKRIAADHGYLTYSAISRAFPALHRVDWLAIELISGFPSGPGMITLNVPQAAGLRSASSRLGTPNSKLSLRIPAEHYRDVLPLAGKRLDIGGHQIRLGLPVARPLEPAPSLYARIVTIKHHTEPETFIEAVRAKLDQFRIKGRVELPLPEPPAVAGGYSSVSSRSDNSKPETKNPKPDFRYRRRIITIHGKAIVGFSVAVHDLNDENSLLLQAGAVKVVSPDDGATQWQSIFSRRAMGCGVFNPVIGNGSLPISDVNYRP